MNPIPPLSTTTRPLRDYQQRAVDAVVTAVRQGKRRPLVVAPTGAGKTRIGSELVVLSTRRGKRVLWVAHRTELLAQAVASLMLEGIHPGVIAPQSIVDAIRSAVPGWYPPSNPLVYCASIQTLLARVNDFDGLPDFDLVILDEGHHYVSPEWGAVARKLQRAVIVGLTATPERGDGLGLDALYDCLIPVAQPRDLIALGHLVPVDVWGPPNVQQGALACDPVRAWIDHPQAHGRRTIVFCASIEHAQQLAQRWQAAGYAAECVDGEMPADDRRCALERFARGRTTVLTNVFVLTEGFDLPAIEVVVLARGFSAQGTFIQAVGRAMRTAKGKDRALLLDLVGAVFKHGLPHYDRDYTLEGAIRTAKSEKLEAIRQCRKCGAVFVSRTTACPRCGAFVPRPPTPEEKAEQLAEIQRVATLDEKVRELTKLRFIAGRKGWHAGQIAAVFKTKFGHYPTPAMWRAA